MNDQTMPEAGPSKPMPPPRTFPKESRRARKAREEGNPLRGSKQNGVPSQAVAGPSSGTNSVEAARLARKNEKKQRKAEAVSKGKGDEWDCVPISRGSVTPVPPVWSSDGRFYFTVSNTSIHIHSSSPPAFERLSTMGSGPDGHSENITALLLHPTNPMQIITASEDGTVKVWDWVEGRLIRTLVLAEGGKVLHVALGLVGGKWIVFANVALPKHNHDVSKTGYYLNFKVVRMALAPPAPGSNSVAYHVGKLSYTPTALIISPRFTYLVALSASKAYTYRLPVNPTQVTWKPSCVKFVSDQHFTCGAFAPDKLVGGRSDEEWFATGDVKGVIRLWHGLTSAFSQVDAVAAAHQGLSDPFKAVLPDTEKRLPTTSLHWHAHAVSAVAFTPSGAQLLSVGEESVLVQWHLASGKREYIPRLGGRPIVTLAVKAGGRGVEEEWWVQMEDGGVARIGSSSGQITTVGQDVRLDPLRPKDRTAPYPLAIHPPTKSLVLPSSHSSTLQFVDPHSSSVLFDLEVAPSNRVSRRDEKIHESVSVECVAFSDHTEGPNRWMATIEGRKGDDAEGGGLVKTLKFWRWVDDKYRISTQIPRPHGSANIVKVEFSPASSGDFSQPYLLTASSDGTAKIWHVRSAKRPEQGKGKKKAVEAELFWSTRSSFAYRSLPIYDAVFSPDSTLVAFAHGTVVTLWDVEKNVLLRALEGGLKEVKQLGFVGQDGRYLATSGESSGIAMWDLLSCDVAWSNTAAPCFRLLAGPTHPFFTAVHEPSKGDLQTRIHVHGTKHSHPLRIVKANGKISRAILLPLTAQSPSYKQLRFAGIAYNGEITRFGDDITRDVTIGTNAIRSNSSKQVSIWQEMFGKDAFLEAEGATTDIAPRADVARKSGNPVDIFEGPSHTLPPVSLLFDAFLEQILVPKPVIAEGHAGEQILYEQQDEVSLNPTANRQVAREVQDAEVAELEVFFRDMLNTSDKHAERLPNGHAKVHGQLKGGGVSNGKGAPSPKTPKEKKHKERKAPSTNGAGETDGDEVVVAGTPGGSSKRKKRKAPKEDA